jgi:hypothetical protein
VLALAKEPAQRSRYDLEQAFQPTTSAAAGSGHVAQLLRLGERLELLQ